MQAEFERDADLHGQANQGDDQPLGAVLDFMRLLWGVEQGLQGASRRLEANHGISGPQRLVIRIVGRFPGVSAGRVAEMLRVHPSTLTGILKRLETNGLLQRRIDPRDGRRALFSLTVKGRKLDQLKSGTVEAAVRRVLASMPETVVAAQQVLARLAEELEKTK